MIRDGKIPNMSADSWLEAAKTEEQRLRAEIGKTTFYKRLVAVRAVIALYDGTSAPATTPEELGATVPSMRTSGQASRHTFKTATALSSSSTNMATARDCGRSARQNSRGTAVVT